MNTAQTVLFNLGALQNLTSISHKCAVISDAEGKPLAGFTIVGKNSEQYRAVQRDIRIENLQRGASRTKDVDTKTEEGAALVIDAVVNNEQRTAIAVVTGWFGFGSTDEKGDTVETPFDASQLPAIFAQMPTWQDKVLSDLDKEANFMPGSSNA